MPEQPRAMGCRSLTENVSKRQVQEKGMDMVSGGVDGSQVYATSALPFKDGHPGILATDVNDDAEKTSTYRESHKAPEKPGVRTVGRKKELMERALYAQVSKEVNEELNTSPPQPDYVSVTRKDFTVKDFKHELPPPEREHNVETEQPVTFWSAHKEKIHGVTQMKTLDTPFRKNTSFSKPIEESFDQAKPYQGEPLPFM